MVRNASSAEHNFIASSVFYYLVVVDDSISVSAFNVLQSHVDINSGTGFVKLGHSERNPGLFLLVAKGTCFVMNSLADTRAERGNLGPRARGLKTLSSNEMVRSEISDIGNEEGKNVTLHSVFGASSHASELSSDG